MPAPDAIVVGAGIAGLTAALACADRALNVTIVSTARTGVASAASAGVLGPSIGRGPKGGRVGGFMFAARDRYPSYLEQLCDRSRIRVPVTTGAMELALNDTHLAELRSRAARLGDTELLDARAVADVEPGLVPVAGALFHTRDGAVDTSALLAALVDATSRHPRVTRVNGDVASLGAMLDTTLTLALADGSRLAAPNIVLAAGAWVSAITGLPLLLQIRPVRGEIAIVADTSQLRHVTFGAGGYLVPRGGELLIGATSDEVGFDADLTDSAALELAATARMLLRDPRSCTPPFTARHVGLRPMTPDGYPILGRDPDRPAILYACGYSRNGVLLSPLAADCIAALITGENVGYDLTAFSVSRFGG
jgi:glycine oxidase